MISSLAVIALTLVVTTSRSQSRLLMRWAKRQSFLQTTVDMAKMPLIGIFNDLMILLSK